MMPLVEKPLVLDCQGEQLVAILHPAIPSTRPGVLIVVGGPQYRVGSHRQFTQLARALATHGYPVLRFDCRGMGDGSGAFPGFEHTEADIRVAIDAFMREVPALSGVVIFGLCDAAAAALLYCRSDERVRSLVLANPWVRSASGEARSFVKHYYAQRLLQGSFWRSLFTGQVNVFASAWDFARKLVRARSPSGSSRGAALNFIDRMLAGLESFRGRSLFLLSERDLTAQEFRDLCGASARWGEALRKPEVTVQSCAAADHTFSTVSARDAATAAMLEWLRQVEESSAGVVPRVAAGAQGRAS
jgi:exosortase A-associated hydrolase 1